MTVKNLELRQDIRSKIVSALEEAISNATITSNNYLVRTAFYRLEECEKDLQKKKDFWALCEEYISDRPLQDFFFETLDSELKSREFVSGDKEIFLKDLKEYEDASNVAERLVAGFEALPNAYRIFIACPLWLTAHFENFAKESTYEIATGFRLKAYDATHKETFPEITVPNHRRTFSLFHSGPSEIKLVWTDWIPYFEFDVRGFVGPWEQTQPLHQVTVLHRAFFGLAYSLGLIKRTWASRGDEEYLLAYQKHAYGWRPERAREIPIDVGRAVDGFSIERIDGNSHFGTEEQQWLRRLNVMSKVFSHATNEPIVKAAQWLFDSFVGQDDINSFVKATVCLEILLGDKKASEEIGLNTLLSNHCAYLISSNRAERAGIIKEFKSIYDTRSSIVHTGKNYLNNKERSDLFRLRQLCKQVIRREILL